jgi:hypothetical protein
MYAKIENDAVVQYPYGIAKLKKENPNTSFPINFLDDPHAIKYGVVIVKEIPRPNNPGFVYSDVGPSLIDGTWTQVWEERRKDVDELTPFDIHEVDQPEQAGFHVLEGDPTWDGEKYVQTWELVEMSPIEKRVIEYGAPELQLEFITENGLEAWQAKVAEIKASYPKS